METIIVGFLASIGTAGLVLYVVLRYYNNVRTCIKDILSLLAASFGWFKSTSTRLSIETNGTKAIDNLNRIVPELDLPELCIEWVKTDEHGQVRLEPGKAIVLLKYNKDNTQNIINTTAAYVHKTLLQSSKLFMDKGISTAIDFSVIREFLNNTPQKNYIVTQFVQSCSDDIDSYGDAFNKVIKVEDEGLLTRVLLREYAIWGNKLAGKIRNTDYEKESIQFLDFIFNIASREFDELTPLVFKVGAFKVAVLLVAKYDTYTEKGITPYVRRIREEFADGVNTFYLLARNDKIEILNKVYGEIMSSGNYNLLNGPEVYKDNVGRDNICYCIEVRADADLAIAYEDIKSRIGEERVIEAIITNIYIDEIKCEYNGLTITIPRTEITDNKDLRLKNYYTTGMTIEVLPLKIIERGDILCSLKNTKSTPQLLFDNQYEVGNTVFAIVENAEDDFISLRVKDTDQQCVSYRRDLTPSRFDYLHVLFPVGKEFEFIIKDIDYVYNRLVLKYAHIKNPWDNVSYNIGDEVECEIYNKKDTCFETELGDGLYAILPNSELAWLESEREAKKRTLKRTSKVKASIKKIIPVDKLIILTCKEKKSPYVTYFESLNQDRYVKSKIVTRNSYGIIGLVENKYNLFIPLSETYIGENKYKCKDGGYYEVKLIDVNNRGDSFIGSFKPFITHPLNRFNLLFHEGQVLSHLQFVRATENGAYFRISYDRNKNVEALLLNRDVSNWCFIKDLGSLFSTDFTCPMVIREISLERNVVLLSIKELTSLNEERLNTIEYGRVCTGVIMGHNFNDYSVLLDNIWVEVHLESELHLKIGDRVNVLKASANAFMLSD